MNTTLRLSLQACAGAWCSEGLNDSRGHNLEYFQVMLLHSSPRQFLPQRTWQIEERIWYEVTNNKESEMEAFYLQITLRLTLVNLVAIKT
jgi:hypothetical protein